MPWPVIWRWHLLLNKLSVFKDCGYEICFYFIIMSVLVALMYLSLRLVMQPCMQSSYPRRRVSIRYSVYYIFIFFKLFRVTVH
ncbi:MAG: hypothetical protein ACI8SR_002574 [Oceanicoccus sp.]|jgi:hypothetical protein